MERQNRTNPKYKTVLITRFSALGDIAMTIPVVYSACMANPDVHFVMVTQKVPASLFINTPENLTVEGIDFKNLKNGVLGLHSLYASLLEKYQFDAYVDLHDVLRTKVLSLFCKLDGIKVKHINKGRSGKRALTRSSNKRMFPLISSHARYREVFSHIGLNVDESFYSLFGNSKADTSIFSEITPEKKDGEKWVAIAPFAKHKGKIYPSFLMEKVVEKLSRRPNTKIFLFGAGDEERSVLKDWSSKFENTLSLAEKRNGFPTELALLSHADVMISMDSANMHLASLVRVPVVSVWGATHPYCGFMGWNQEEHNSVQLNMTCRPCSVFGNKPCSYGDYRCLTTIPPSMIEKAVLRIIDSK